MCALRVLCLVLCVRTCARARVRGAGLEEGGGGEGVEERLGEQARRNVPQRQVRVDERLPP